jgi:putative copper export protein
MVILVWLHLIAAVAWIGGMIFLSIVLAPTLKHDAEVVRRMAVFRAVAVRFRGLVWGAAGVLVMTGPVLLRQKGLSVLEPRDWPPILVVKLALVLLLVSMTATHDFWIGPRAAGIRQRPEANRSRAEQALVLTSPWFARLSLVLALAVLWAAVALARQ